MRTPASVQPPISQFDLSLHPLAVVKAVTGKSRSTLYKEIIAGLFIPPVKISVQSSRWPGREICALNNARIAGKSSEEIKKLVGELVSARQEAK